jgi:amidohydrolase
MRALERWLAAHTEDLVAFRRQLHAHPELSGEEHLTTELLVERLELAGLTVRPLSSGTGLLCDLGPTDLEDDGPVFALRGDLDGLAMDDDKDVHYRSRVAGVSHACGHDVHTTVVLGAALYWAHHRDEIPGRLRFVFQPAEERVPGGALDVLADDGLADVAGIVGLHCEPKADVGTIGCRPGPISSAADMATITLTGPGGHTARPELTVDTIALAARVVMELPGRVAARLPDPGDVKIVFGAIAAGDAANVIPTHAVLRASIRTPSVDIWETIHLLFEEELAAIVDTTHAGFELDYVHGVPPVHNDSRLTQIVRRAATAELGPEAVHDAQQSWGGDDFAWFTRATAGSYVRLGVHDPSADGPRLYLHAGHFDVDERAIPIGVRVLVATAVEFFADLR